MQYRLAKLIHKSLLRLYQSYYHDGREGEVESNGQTEQGENISRNSYNFLNCFRG
jgi:hypothetical protein